MPVNKDYRQLKNEYDEGGSKSMIAFSDTYVALGEYEDTFEDFLQFLCDVEGRLTDKKSQKLQQISQDLAYTP